MYNCSPDYELQNDDAKKRIIKLEDALKKIYNRAKLEANRGEDIAGYCYIENIAGNALLKDKEV